MSGVDVRDQVVMMPRGISPRVCIIAAFNDRYAPLAEIARPNWFAYAKRHGYAVRWYPQGWHDDPDRPFTYGDKGRFECYYDVRGLCDVVMYLDIDTLFMNHGLAIPRSAVDRFLWAYDENGPQSGMWIARTDELTERHLRYAYTRAATESNVRHGKIEPNGISDQDAMRDLMSIPPFKDTFGNCVPAKSIGHVAESQWNRGDWLMHFGGLTFEEKLERMRKHVNSGV